MMWVSGGTRLQARAAELHNSRGTTYSATYRNEHSVPSVNPPAPPLELVTRWPGLELSLCTN